jgi:hypothetical protein
MVLNLTEIPHSLNAELEGLDALLVMLIEKLDDQSEAATVSDVNAFDIINNKVRFMFHTQRNIFYYTVI